MGYIAIRWDGGDSDFMYFSCDSESCPGVERSLTISKRTGELYCDCPGSVYHKYGHFRYDDWDAPGCRHARGLRQVLRDHLEGSKP